MVYKIRYTKDAIKYLDAQTQVVRKRIFRAIELLPEGDIIKLKASNGFRLRVGVYRIIFDYVDSSTISIKTIAPRGDVYKK